MLLAAIGVEVGRARWHFHIPQNLPAFKNARQEGRDPHQMSSLPASASMIATPPLMPAVPLVNQYPPPLRAICSTNGHDRQRLKKVRSE
jgi:hypothetical protein